MHNHVLALCAFCKALPISMPESMSSSLSATAPLDWDFAPATAISEVENDYSILTVVVEL
jgi:hypothetical protein